MSTLTGERRKCKWIGCHIQSSSNVIYRSHSNVIFILRIVIVHPIVVVIVVVVVNGVIQGIVFYEHGFIFCTGIVGDGDIVAQDGYPLQSEGRAPGDEDSGGVNEGHSEVTDRSQQTCTTSVS